jgi:hypothetical protein
VKHVLWVGLAALMVCSFATVGLSTSTGLPPPRDSTSTYPQLAQSGGNPPPDTAEVGPPLPQGNFPTSSLQGQPPNDPFSVRDLSQSPWFALVSGLASILGLLLALYTTQVRTIPFSLYRSLMWRKVLLLASGIGLLVFSGIQFYTQKEAPAVEAIGYVHALLLGVYRVSAVDHRAHGASVWAILFVLATVLFLMGVNYDPAARARDILVREQEALQSAQQRQVSRVLDGREVDNLPPAERRMFNDTLDYYRHVQWRFADVVLGAPSPTFPLFLHDPSRLKGEDGDQTLPSLHGRAPNTSPQADG